MSVTLDGLNNSIAPFNHSLSPFDPEAIEGTTEETSKEPELRDNLSHTVAPEPLSESDYRKYMNQFWTIRRPVTEACGHKLDTESQPNTNCLLCWFTWFNHNKENVALCDEIVQKFGPETIIRMRGKKFWKFFMKYMAACEVVNNAALEAELGISKEVKEENDGNNTAGDSNPVDAGSLQ